MDYNIAVRTYPNHEIRAVKYKSVANRSVLRSDGPGRDEDGGAGTPLIGGGSCAPSGCQSSVPPLDITSKLSRALSPGYGGEPRATRFGLRAKRILSRAAGVFDHDRIPGGQCLFLTGTIPASTREAFDAMAKWSSWVVKSVKTWISNLKIEDNYSLYCWEFQSRGALHLHYLQLVKDERKRQIVMWKWAIKWAQILDSVGEREGVDMWNRGDGRTWACRKSVLQAPAQFVKKSVGCYLGKYVGKDAGAGNRKGGPCLSPVRWWGCSRPLLARLDELTEVLSIENISHSNIRYVWQSVSEAFRHLGNGFHEYQDKKKFACVIVGYDPDYREVFNLLWRDLRCRTSSIITTKPSLETSPIDVAKPLPRWRTSVSSSGLLISGRTVPNYRKASTRAYVSCLWRPALLALRNGLILKSLWMHGLNLRRKGSLKQLTLQI